MAKKRQAFYKRLILSELRPQDEKVMRKELLKSIYSKTIADNADAVWVLYTYVKPKDKIPKILTVVPDKGVHPIFTWYLNSYQISEVTNGN